VAATIQVGKTPHWVTASADGRTAYVTNEGSNDVSVVDVASRRVIATIPVGNAPRKIAVQAGSGQAAAPGSGAPGPVASAARSVLRGGMTFVDHGTRDVRGQASLHLEADDYYFSPTFLRGTPGQKLRLLVESESGTLHNVSIPAQKIDRDIPPHGKAMVEVTFPASGVVRLFCKVHTALGMNGELMAADSPAQ
jgi:YVTN family beta-propeller protein